MLKTTDARLPYSLLPVEQRMKERHIGIATLCRDLGIAHPLMLSVIYGHYPDPEVRAKLATALGATEEELFPEPPIDGSLTRQGPMADLSSEQWLKSVGLEPYDPAGEDDLIARVAAGTKALADYEKHRIKTAFGPSAEPAEVINLHAMVTLFDYPDGRSYLLEGIRNRYCLPSGEVVSGPRAAVEAFEREGGTQRRVTRLHSDVGRAIRPEQIAQFYRLYEEYRREIRLYAGRLADWLDDEDLRHRAVHKMMMGETQPGPTKAEAYRESFRRALRDIRFSVLDAEGAPVPQARGRGAKRDGWLNVTKSVATGPITRLRNSKDYIVLVERRDGLLFWPRVVDAHGMLSPDGSGRIALRALLLETLSAKRRAFHVRASAMTLAEVDELEKTALEAIAAFARTELGATPGPEVRGTPTPRPTRPAWTEFLEASGADPVWTPRAFERD